MQVVLASASPRRRELLKALTPTFSVVASEIPEPLNGDAPSDAVALARAKALAVAAGVPGAMVIGADTIVYDGLRLYGKPSDADDATAMLARLQGRAHKVVTGIAVVVDGAVSDGVSVADVTLSSLSYRAIAAYVASGRPLDKAGAYAIQDEDVPTVRDLDGCYCAVMGLPLWQLRDLMVLAGLPCSPPDTTYRRCAVCPERRVEGA